MRKHEKETTDNIVYLCACLRYTSPSLAALQSPLTFSFMLLNV